jgi:hypothetical protein
MVCAEKRGGKTKKKYTEVGGYSDEYLRQAWASSTRICDVSMFWLIDECELLGCNNKWLRTSLVHAAAGTLFIP